MLGEGGFRRVLTRDFVLSPHERTVGDLAVVFVHPRLLGTRHFQGAYWVKHARSWKLKRRFTAVVVSEVCVVGRCVRARFISVHPLNPRSSALPQCLRSRPERLFTVASGNLTS